MTDASTIVLNEKQIQQKIDRIAFQIYEHHFEEKEVILAGIVENGFELARLINERLQQISNLNTTLVPLYVNKQDPYSTRPSVELERSQVQDRAVIIVDDVLNSGRTLMYGIKYFLEVPMRSLRTVALVDRDHKRFPVKADYVGLELSTTLQEHVRVELKKNEMTVYLD